MSETSTLAGEADRVVLLDAERRPAGTADREQVHVGDTPLHLAFSCWLGDGAGNLLLTRRALSKRSWPGVWTNSFCGHPRPSEELRDALERYSRRELGVGVVEIQPLLPDFAYRAVDPSGVVENEVCPVFTARLDGDPSEVAPSPDEVVEHRWVTVDELRSALRFAGWALSPWLREQAAQLEHDDGWAIVAARAAGSDERTAR